MTPFESNRSRKRADTPKAIEDCHALVGWMLPQLDKFPRARRFILGIHIEEMLLSAPEKLVKTASLRSVAGPLRAANLCHLMCLA